MGLKLTIGAALGALLVSTLFGILVSWLRNYHEPTLESLERLLEEGFWQGRAIIGTKRAAEVQLKVLRDARMNNDGKSQILGAALVAEVIGIIAIAVSVGLVIFQA